MLGALKGVEMELRDCAYSLIHEIICTSDTNVAFRDVDVAILVGSFPRKKGMERKDLLTKVCKVDHFGFSSCVLIGFFLLLHIIVRTPKSSRSKGKR
jgi:hypothetical protein